jgi:hypothetical protein
LLKKLFDFIFLSKYTGACKQASGRKLTQAKQASQVVSQSKMTPGYSYK